MDFAFTFEQKMIQESARKIFEKYYPIEEIRKFIDSPAINRDFLREIAESGFLGMIAGEEGCGLGLGAVDALPVLIEAGKSIVPFPILESMIASKILSITRPEIAESIVLGEKIATVSWTDLEAQFDDVQKVKLSGTCSLVPFAGFADYMIAPIKISDSAEKAKVQLVCIDLKNENILFEKINSMDLTYPLFKVHIRDYPIKNEEVISKNEDGNRLFTLMSKLGAVFLSAEMLGASEKSLNKGVKYTKERVQFGQQIGKFQALKHLAAESYVKQESIRSATEYAAWAFDQGLEDLSLSIAKGYTSETALKIIQNAIQMHGGIGFTWENETHFYLKRVLRSSHTLGDSYTHLEAIAAEVVG